jgi:hypothetical protein
MHISSLFVAAAFGGIFWILCKFLPILLEPVWFCTLALTSKPRDFLQKSFLDPQHVISSLNRWEKNRTPHRLGASGSFLVFSFHAGLKSGVSNSKNQKNARQHLSPRCHPLQTHAITLWKISQSYHFPNAINYEIKKSGVGIPQSYHFPLIHVATCVRVLREATSISEVSPSSDTCDNTLENLGSRAGNSLDGSTRGALRLHGVVSCSYCLTKQNKVKRSTGQPSLEESQRGRPRGPTWLEFRCTRSLRVV